MRIEWLTGRDHVDRSSSNHVDLPFHPGGRMFKVVVGDFTVTCHTGVMPQFGVDPSEHAELVDEFDVEKTDAEPCLLAISRTFDWPFLVVKQRCKHPGLFGPCVLLVPETKKLFVGTGERLLAYSLDGPERLWEDSTDCGIWNWSRHGRFVILAAELELAAWDIHGHKLWTTFVEPPWSFRVNDDTIELDVMGNSSKFPVECGPVQE